MMEVQESDNDDGAREMKVRKTESQVVWITSGTTCRLAGEICVSASARPS